MKQRKCPMVLNYHRPLMEFNIRAQDHHLEKNILLLFLSYLFKHSHEGSVDYSRINHTCHLSVTKESTLAHTSRHFTL